MARELAVRYWREIVKIGVETLVICLVVRLRYRSRKDVIGFPQHVVDKLVEEFDPDDLVKHVPSDLLLPDVYNQDALDLAGFDVFELGGRNKDEIVEVIRRYGVGTCGPRGFYGTLDLHLELEKMIAEELGAECAIVYPNSFTAVNSIIACFCRQQDIVFYHKDCNEAILRGVSLSRATTIEFKDVSDLEIKLEYFARPKLKNFVVVEGLFRNTGHVVDIRRILELRRKHGFRVILDESCSIPLLHRRGVCGVNGVSVREIDVLIGSLGHGFCSSGAFSTGSLYTVDYQRLAGSSYCFSASTPGALIKAAILNIKADLDHDALSGRLEVFHSAFESKTFEVVSSRESPIIIVAKKKELRKAMSNEALLKEVLDIRRELAGSNVVTGLNHNPHPSIRMCLKISMSDEDVSRAARLLARW